MKTEKKIAEFPELKHRLRLILSEQSLKQTELAKALGISANYVYLLTSGRKKAVSEPLARLIESKFGYSAKWILTGLGKKRAFPQKERLKNETIGKIRRMSPGELRAVMAFIRSMETIDEPDG